MVLGEANDHLVGRSFYGKYAIKPQLTVEGRPVYQRYRSSRHQRNNYLYYHEGRWVTSHSFLVGPFVLQAKDPSMTAGMAEQQTALDSMQHGNTWHTFLLKVSALVVPRL
jgi:hypothetical protein